MKQNTRKSNFGWLELILGILFIALGIYTFMNPSNSFAGVVAIYGVAAIVTGIVDIVLYVKLERRTGFGPVTSLVTGIFSILAGILILFNPDVGGWAISILFPVWFISHCISRLANTSITRFVAGPAYNTFSLIVNILGIFLGIMLLFNPVASAYSFTYIIGIYLIVLGVGSIVMAFKKTNIPQ